MTDKFTQMKRSLHAIDLPTRPTNVLSNMAHYHDDLKTWNDVVRFYQSDPTEFVVRYLRTPGGGRKSLDIVIKAIHEHLDNAHPSGRIVWVLPEDVQAMRQALDIVMRFTDNATLNEPLKRLRQLLDAKTIHTRI